jgi:hypothetical protein
MADSTNSHAVDFLREHVRKHFSPGLLSTDEQARYYALVHAGWRLTKAHPQYPPEGCWWRPLFWETS